MQPETLKHRTNETHCQLYIEMVASNSFLGCLLAIFVTSRVVESATSESLLHVESAYNIELYDPQVRSDDGWEKIVYYSKQSTRQSLNTPLFLEEGETADPDPQNLAPHRLECDCTFRKADPQGRPDSQYHYGKIPPSAANYLADKKLRNVVKSRAAAGSKIPEIRNIDLATGKLRNHDGEGSNAPGNSLPNSAGTSFLEIGENTFTIEFLEANAGTDD
eukprot:g6363.t1